MSVNNKSISLTHFMVRSFYAVLVAVVVGTVCYSKFVTFSPYHMVPLWLNLPLGLGALVCLDKLLINIKGALVFDIANTKLLSKLSILCFVASLITMLSYLYIIIAERDSGSDYFTILVLCIIFPIMSIGEFFVGLVVRVVKNMFEKAIEIKSENDLTI